MDYPFNNETWATVLNANGIVKIDNTLYKFTKESQISIAYGNNKKLREIMNNPQKINLSKARIDPCNRLKSLSPDNFGTLWSKRKWDREEKYVLDVSLMYEIFQSHLFILIPETGTSQWVDVNMGYHYYIYCHQRVKRWYGWFDANTHLYWSGNRVDIGGNQDCLGNEYTHVNILENPTILTSPNDLSNHYIYLYGVLKNMENNPTPSSCPPIINQLKFNFWTGKVSDRSNYINMDI